MSYIGTTEIGKMFLGDVEIDKAYLGNDLVFSSDVAPDPLQFITYIETDGVAYINTGINGNDPKSCEIKFLPKHASGLQSVLSSGNMTDGATSTYSLMYISGGDLCCFAHNYLYTTGSPSIANSINNGTPFVAKTNMARRSQKISVRQEGETSDTSLSKTQSSTITTNRAMFLFASNGTDGTARNKCVSGSRVYYCKIYNTASYTSLVFDGVPCIYYGEYGLWDNVSNSFFGNAAGSGSFTGA